MARGGVRVSAAEGRVVGNRLGCQGLPVQWLLTSDPSPPPPPPPPTPLHTPTPAKDRS